MEEITNRSASTAAPLQEYLRQTTGVWLGISPEQWQSSDHRLPEELSDILLRREESENPVRDQWGNWEFSYSSNYRSGQLWNPQVSQWIAETRQREGKTRSLWPRQHKFAVCLTHDVDLISSQMSFRQVVRRATQMTRARDAGGAMNCAFLVLRSVLGSLRRLRPLPDTTASLGYLYDIEKKFGVRSSYFVVVPPGDPVSRYDMWYALDDICLFRGQKMSVAQMLGEFANEGHDIGLHGSIFSATNAAQLKRQRETLEHAVGRPVVSTRQHYLRYDIDRTLEAQEQAGFRVDCTLGFNRNVGFRSGTCHPYRMFHLGQSRPSRLLQIPLIVQDGALFAANALELPEAMAKDTILRFIEAAEKTEGCFSLLFHPDQFENPQRRRIYEWALEVCLERGAWCTSAAEIESWWTQLEGRLS